MYSFSMLQLLFSLEACTPWKINMEPENQPLERKFLLDIIIFRFHVKLWGCSVFFWGGGGGGGDVVFKLSFLLFAH